MSQTWTDSLEYLVDERVNSGDTPVSVQLKFGLSISSVRRLMTALQSSPYLLDVIKRHRCKGWENLQQRQRFEEA
jgi:hypothetical protein